MLPSFTVLYQMIKGAQTTYSILECGCCVRVHTHIPGCLDLHETLTLGRIVEIRDENAQQRARLDALIADTEASAVVLRNVVEQGERIIGVKYPGAKI